MTQAPYGLISDLHAFNWSSFSSLDSEGRNTRLMAIIHEIDRVCDETLKAGGQTVVIAGDLFHSRGTVDPSVFNPVRKAIMRRCHNDSIYFTGIAGNHDLKDKESKELGSSVEMLSDMSGKQIYFHHKPFATQTTAFPVAFVPWFPTPGEYLAAIQKVCVDIAARGDWCEDYDLICHIGIDGTIKGMPDHGVTPEKLASFGFKRVFSGHYHHHMGWEVHRNTGIVPVGSIKTAKVFSIGAPTHHTWSDVGTNAGFMIVHDDREQWFASHAPSFIDVTGEEDPEELPLLVDGHFVRVHSASGSAADVGAMREAFMNMGAAGVQIHSVPETAGVKREGVTSKSLAALDQSVTDYVSERSMKPRVATIAAEILAEVRAA